MRYQRTDIEVMLGDRVIYRHLFFGRSSGVVAYIPGASDPEADKYYDTPDWVVDLENGKSVFMAFGPDLEFAHGRIEFVERGGTEEASGESDSV